MYSDKAAIESKKSMFTLIYSNSKDIVFMVRGGYSTRKATVNRVLFTTTIVAAGAAREAGGQQEALPTAEQEGRDFLLNSCLIRSIHLLFLYREVYFTPK